MDYKKSKRLLMYMAVIYWVFAVGIYTIAYPQFRHSPVTGEKLIADAIVGEVIDGMEFCQELVSPCEIPEGKVR